MVQMQSIYFLIKPASGLCNMRCGYCFYFDELTHREEHIGGMMQESTVDSLIDMALSGIARECVFAFQGGEPTLAGLPFFEAFAQKVRDKNVNNLPVSYAIQTNGLLIDENWAAFFAHEKFLVGVSVDGNADLHNLYRKDSAKKDTHNRIMRGITQLRRHKVEHNILTVVTAQTAKRAGQVYGFFKKQGFTHQQYIACLDPVGGEWGGENYSLTPELYGDFLCKIFDLWYRDLKVDEQPYIRYFDNLIGMLLGYPPETCGMWGECTRQMVIEADGSVYPCDFYCMDGYKLGNVSENTIDELEAKRREINFIEDSLIIPDECKVCKWYKLCRCGCKRDRDNNGILGINKHCEAYKIFFERSYPKMEQIARNIMENQRRQQMR